MNELQPHVELARKVAEAMQSLISEVPASRELAVPNPKLRAQNLAEIAAKRAAVVSGGLAIVPGPFGFLTIIPALGEIWRIQRQLVSDIAAAYGKTAVLTPTVMVYCLFRHGSATVFKETVVQVGTRFLVREASLRTFEKIIGKISVNITQRLIGQFISRWIPILGSAAIGAYTYRDTRKVAATAIDSFENEIEAEFVVLPPEQSIRK